MFRLSAWIVVMGVAVAVPAVAGAQGPSTAERPWLVEGGVGHAEFADSPPVPHTVVGVGTRVYVTPRLAVGPEFTWMRGPGLDRDTFLTGNVTWDLRSAAPSAPVRFVPYLLAGGGMMSHTGEIGNGGTFSSTEGTFTAGGGLRLQSSRGFYVATELRLGWETHWRAGVVVGFRK